MVNPGCVEVVGHSVQTDVVGRSVGLGCEFEGKLRVTARLTNATANPITVYWGDYSHPNMYHFDIRHVATDTSSQSGNRLEAFCVLPALARAITGFRSTGLSGLRKPMLKSAQMKRLYSGFSSAVNR